MTEAKRGEALLKAEETAAKCRATGETPKKGWFRARCSCFSSEFRFILCSTICVHDHLQPPPLSTQELCAQVIQQLAILLCSLMEPEVGKKNIILARFTGVVATASVLDGHTPNQSAETSGVDDFICSITTHAL
ncbi:unnamed protein product [Lactuca virosa]|uniref:Uncharacterized protein n=1 Tax=Lactuca virosa TaxID=75947 RepID=A0AAU9NGR7_9ASTR|nr:unnamed protein product [Lactuca virosa]